MKLEIYRQLGGICFKNAVMYGILSNQFFTMDTMLPHDLVQILACPICKGAVFQPENGDFLRCASCNWDYPVIGGIPAMLPGQSDTGSGSKGETA